MSHCETCNSEFSCGRLAAALKVAEATPDFDTKAELKRATMSVRKALEGAKWRYPDSEAGCALAGCTDEIRNLTEDLIAALANPHHHMTTRDPHRSLLDEELSNE